MYGLFGVINGKIEALLDRTYPCAGPFALDFDCPGAELSAPLCYRRPCPDGGWPGAIDAEITRRPPELDGAPLIESIEERNGHVLFHISAGAYSAAMAHIISSREPPPIPENTDGPTDYAIARMLMLARRGGHGCPGVPSVKRALWLAFGIEGFGGKKGGSMRRRAAEAALSMTVGLSPAERRALRDRLGEVGKCAAILLGAADL